MKFKDFKNNSYGLEAKEIPPRPKTFEDVYEDVKEDIEVTDSTGKAYDFARQYIDTYKGSYRPVPKIITKGGNIRKFILKGPDEKFVADMLTGPQGKRSRLSALRNLKITQRKVK